MQSKETKEVSTKTYKREIAVTLLVFFCYIVFTENVEMVEVIVWPIMAFAMAAFGLDGYAKQVQKPNGNRPDDSPRGMRD